MVTGKRLIDAMQLVTKLSKMVHCEKSARKVYDNALYCIAEAPTVDAVEVVHGHWFWKTLNENSWVLTCSVCESMKGSAEEYNYCPNCGAKMDGGKDNEP